MVSPMNYLLAEQIHKDRQQEIMNQLRLDELLGGHRAKRRESMKRLLGLLRPIAALHLLSLNVRPNALHRA